MEKQTKILWITNMMPGFVAGKLKINGTNKEGWIEGAANKLVLNSNIKLHIAFPYDKDGQISYNGGDMVFYGFKEDTAHPEKYDKSLENRIGKILDEIEPNVIHIFGTEFPHCLAVMRNTKWNKRTVIHIQGIMKECEKVYTGNIPEYVVKRKTFRDILRKDSIVRQIEKYKLRAKNENEALYRARHVLGRTTFDKNFINKLNPECSYHRVNETLRKCFYDKTWNIDNCTRHEIFLSQGNYPLKGAHIAIEAIALLKDKIPDIRLYIAGDKITAYETVKDKLKLSSYGKYLRELIKKNDLDDNIIFTGSITEDAMLERYLSAEVFILTSFVENSPNSLGEAMLLGVPSIATNVGGVSSMAEDGEEALLYKAGSSKDLARLIEKLFFDREMKLSLSENARARAHVTHDEETNYQDLLRVYENIR